MPLCYSCETSYSIRYHQRCPICKSRKICYEKVCRACSVGLPADKMKCTICKSTLLEKVLYKEDTYPKSDCIIL